MDTEKKISEIPENDLKKWLEKAFMQYSMDIGQNLTDDQLGNLVIRGYFKLTEEYSYWPVENVKNAFNLALNNDELKSYKLTAKNFFTWLRHAKDIFSTNDIRDRQVGHFEEVYRHAEHDPIISTELANAISWKLANFGNNKSYPKEAWESFPLRTVAEYLKEGKNPHDIINI